MRAACERCEQLQPTDWQPGDLCVHCGEAVRHEVRCAWCAKWTPLATYCRNCGAEVVDEQHYGAARMLKDAGVDRFSIPKQLAAMDPDQVDNFTRIYQRHAIVVTRHVEQLAFLQRWLRHQQWATDLEEALIPELPWPDPRLEQLSTAPIALLDGSPAERVATAAAIESATPLATTRAVAAIARLRLDDWDALPAALDAFRASDSAIQDEAALAITSWRVQIGAGPVDDVGPLVEVLRRSPFAVEAAVRLAALTRGDVAVPDAARTSGDRETAIGAALVTGDVDRLEAALHGDTLEQAAAGSALARLGVTARLAPVLRDAPDDVRGPIVDALAFAKRPLPDLTDALLEVVESTTNDRLREA
ncbi:MAG TPA: hypothetical protein VGM78_00670, partial [Ilumatobacteraceae bacterium]